MSCVCRSLPRSVESQVGRIPAENVRSVVNSSRHRSTASLFLQLRCPGPAFVWKPLMMNPVIPARRVVAYRPVGEARQNPRGRQLWAHKVALPGCSHARSGRSDLAQLSGRESCQLVEPFAQLQRPRSRSWMSTGLHVSDAAQPDLATRRVRSEVAALNCVQSRTVAKFKDFLGVRRHSASRRSLTVSGSKPGEVHTKPVIPTGRRRPLNSAQDALRCSSFSC